MCFVLDCDDCIGCYLCKKCVGYVHGIGLRQVQRAVRTYLNGDSGKVGRTKSSALIKFDKENIGVDGKKSNAIVAALLKMAKEGQYLPNAPVTYLPEASWIDIHKRLQTDYFITCDIRYTYNIYTYSCLSNPSCGVAYWVVLGGLRGEE